MITLVAYLEDLPDHQKKIFWNLVRNIGQDKGSYLTRVPVAVTPDKKFFLRITTRPSQRDGHFGSLGMKKVKADRKTDDLPIMDEQQMRILAR